jgi:hypothetical protein
MRNTPPFFIVIAGSLMLAATAVRADVTSPKSRFVYKDAHGKNQSASIATHYYPKKIVHPFAKVDHRFDPKLMHAATLAEERAHAHSKAQCWHYVKEALVGAGVLSSYPKSAYAKQAGEELVRSYGFKRLSIRDPYSAPVGAILVYAHGGAAGHVEIRTKNGFVSDFYSKTACGYPLIAVYAKFAS